MNEGRVLFLLGEKGDDYHLVKKVVDVIKKLYGKKCSLEYLLSLDSFSETEKKRLKNIFHQVFSDIYAWEFSFYYHYGIWSYKKSIYDHQAAVKKLLILLNKKEFSVRSIVHTNDLSLIATLLREWNEMYANDWRRLRVDEAPRFEINQEVLHFISNNLKERVGEVTTVDFGFVKAFMEAFSDYNVKNLAKILTGGDSIYS
jgi:hypothetical protein